MYVHVSMLISLLKFLSPCHQLKEKRKLPSQAPLHGHQAHPTPPRRRPPVRPATHAELPALMAMSHRIYRTIVKHVRLDFARLISFPVPSRLRPLMQTAARSPSPRHHAATDLTPPAQDRTQTRARGGFGHTASSPKHTCSSSSAFPGYSLPPSQCAASRLPFKPFLHKPPLQSLPLP